MRATLTLDEQIAKALRYRVKTAALGGVIGGAGSNTAARSLPPTTSVAASPA